MERDISWDEIRAFYKARREEWAKAKTYYIGYDLWGDSDMTDYGFDFRPPYTEGMANIQDAPRRPT